MKLNNVQLINVSTIAHSFFFFSQEGEKCWDLYKNVKQFTALSAPNAHMLVSGHGTEVERSILMLQYTQANTQILNKLQLP